MMEPFEPHYATSEQDSEQTAIANALSVHYIVMAFYVLGTLAALVTLFVSFLSRDGMTLGQAALTLFVPTLFTMHLLAVRGLRRRSAWGYNASKGLAFLLLLMFPFGTVLGLILLSQLRKFSFSQ